MLFKDGHMDTVRTSITELAAYPCQRLLKAVGCRAETSCAEVNASLAPLRVLASG